MNLGGTSLSDVTEGKDPSPKHGVVEGEDVPDPACNLAHGQTLDLEQGSCSELVGCAQARNIRGRQTYHVKMLKLHDRPHCRLQASELLAQRGSCGAAFFSGSSGPSSPGCLRCSAEGGFHRRHIRDRHLAITRHLLSLRKKEGEAWDGKQGTEKELWGLELDGSPFIGLFRSTYPTTL